MRAYIPLILLACASTSQAAEAIRNGDFNSGNTDWTLSERASGNQIQVTAEAAAPKPANSEGLHLSVQEQGNLPPLVSQALTSGVRSSFTLSFDFCVTELTTYAGGDGVLLVRLASPGDGPLRPILLVHGNGEISLGQTVLPDLQWNRGTWYSVTISLPAPGKDGEAKVQIESADGKIQKASIAQFSYPSPGSLTEFNGIQLQTGYAQRAVTDVFVDNISLRNLD